MTHLNDGADVYQAATELAAAAERPRRYVFAKSAVTQVSGVFDFDRRLANVAK